MFLTKENIPLGLEMGSGAYITGHSGGKVYILPTHELPVYFIPHFSRHRLSLALDTLLFNFLTSIKYTSWPHPIFAANLSFSFCHNLSACRLEWRVACCGIKLHPKSDVRVVC